MSWFHASIYVDTHDWENSPKSVMSTLDEVFAERAEDERIALQGEPMFVAAYPSSLYPGQTKVMLRARAHRGRSGNTPNG